MEVIQAYQDGESVLSIVRRLGVGTQRVRSFLKSHGVLRTKSEGQSKCWTKFLNEKREKRRPKHLGKKIDASMINEMFYAGATVNEIAANLSVGARRVQHILAELGVILGKGKFKCFSCEQQFDGPAQRKFCKACVQDAFHRRFIKFGVGRKRWNEMLDRQKGTCALCDRSPAFVDHDHLSGAVRGLLCNGCNTALGQIDRDIDWGHKALLYKERSFA